MRKKITRKLESEEYGFGLFVKWLQRNVPVEIWLDIKERELEEDLIGEAVVIYLECVDKGMDYKSASKYFNKKVYEFLKSLGFRKRRVNGKICYVPIEVREKQNRKGEK